MKMFHVGQIWVGTIIAKTLIRNGSENKRWIIMYKSNRTGDILTLQYLSSSKISEDKNEMGIFGWLSKRGVGKVVSSDQQAKLR